MEDESFVHMIVLFLYNTVIKSYFGDNIYFSRGFLMRFLKNIPYGLLILHESTLNIHNGLGKPQKTFFFIVGRTLETFFSLKIA